MRTAVIAKAHLHVHVNVSSEVFVVAVCGLSVDWTIVQSELVIEQQGISLHNLCHENQQSACKHVIHNFP